MSKRRHKYKFSRGARVTITIGDEVGMASVAGTHSRWFEGGPLYFYDVVLDNGSQFKIHKHGRKNAKRLSVCEQEVS